MRDPHQALKHEQIAKGRSATAGVDYLPGLPSTIGSVSLKDLGIDKIAELLIKKLAK